MKGEAKAVVLEKFQEPLVMASFPLPEIREGEVLVKVEAAGVWGSDIHIWEVGSEGSNGI